MMAGISVTERRVSRCSISTRGPCRGGGKRTGWGLGDDGMVFLGMNCSTYLSATDFHGCRGNRIYFTDDNKKTRSWWGCDMGVFCLEDGSLGSHYQTNVKPMWPKPIWVFPNPVESGASTARKRGTWGRPFPMNFYLKNLVLLCLLYFCFMVYYS
ncbi:hypothetical protein QJS04_geneDACA000405 [Acorus gramineus]|uniref:KIB1-4 beta-propeller domain-containing protein n=1 Tax=Acorus gramineus TaxID=55184 RepID=A0AAV9ATA6_ACOGR|nr:hypothetical protein QJS04_geneDACA000405 [Acorus gramineus]